MEHRSHNIRKTRPEKSSGMTMPQKTAWTETTGTVPGSKKVVNIPQPAMSDESDRGEDRSPLDIYCANIRRLKKLNSKDEYRLQIKMSESLDRLVAVLSEFTGSAQFILDAAKTRASEYPETVRRNTRASEVGDAPIASEFKEFPAPETEEDERPDAGERLALPNSEPIQFLAACFDRFYEAVREHGIDHKLTSARRAALSAAFCKLSLTPDCIKALVARLETLQETVKFSWTQDVRPSMVVEDLQRDNFEHAYAIRFADFERIAQNATRLYRDWQQIRNQVAEFHVGLVVYLARQYSSDPQELIDLVQEGNIGLIKAVERFDYRLGFKFSTYATYWIRLAISRYLARSSRAVRLPYRQNLHLGTVRKKREIFEQIHGRAPSTLELAKDTGISEAGLRKLETMSQAVASLDAQLEAGTGLDLMSMVEQHTFGGPAEIVEKQSMQSLIETAIDGLNQREAFVIRERFGIGVYAEKTLQELGSVLGLTRERVRQIESGALKKIRRRLDPLAV